MWTPVDFALDSPAAAENQITAFYTAELEQDLAVAVRKLSSEASVAQRYALVGEALSKARDLATQIGDGSKLALDPDLNSYYLQNIVVKRVPALLSEMGELQALLHGAVPTTSMTNESSQGPPLAFRRDDSIDHRGDQTRLGCCLPRRRRRSTKKSDRRQVWFFACSGRRLFGDCKCHD